MPSMSYDQRSKRGDERSTVEDGGDVSMSSTEQSGQDEVGGWDERLIEAPQHVRRLRSTGIASIGTHGASLGTQSPLSTFDPQDIFDEAVSDCDTKRSDATVHRNPLDVSPTTLLKRARLWHNNPESADNLPRGLFPNVYTEDGGMQRWVTDESAPNAETEGTMGPSQTDSADDVLQYTLEKDPVYDMMLASAPRVQAQVMLQQASAASGTGGGISAHQYIQRQNTLPDHPYEGDIHIMPQEPSRPFHPMSQLAEGEVNPYSKGMPYYQGKLDLKTNPTGSDVIVGSQSFHRAMFSTDRSQKSLQDWDVSAKYYF